MPNDLKEILDSMPVTLFIMAMMLFWSIAGFKNKGLYLKMILHPGGMIRKKEYYRLFTSDLVHNDFAHLLLNEIMAFYICGNLEEVLRKMSYWGSFKFISIYLISNLAGKLVTTWRQKRNFEYSSAGASGSILGCMMSFTLVKPNFVGFYLPVIGGIKNIFFGLIVLLGLIIYQRRSGNEMMDHEVHFYSALGGIIGTFILFPYVIR